jgi:5-methylcytosine-specific restriction endonuclease McrA
VRPLSAATYSLHVTLDAALKADLDELVALLGHKIPSGDLTAVLRVAVRCALEKYGKRKGAKAVRNRAPGRAQESAAGPATARSGRPHVPVAVRREVWARDGGQCTFRGPDGQRCPARSRIEYDHIVPVALGGSSTVDNVRLRCKTHNLLHAEEVFGRDRIARFRRGSTSPGETAALGRGAPGGGASATFAKFVMDGAL